MATGSIFQRLDNQDAIIHVGRDEIKALRPGDARSAIGAQNLNGCSCLVMMGTSAKSTVIMAQISGSSLCEYPDDSHLSGAKRALIASDGEVHYMKMLRQMINVFTTEQELFQLPLAFGIFGYDRKHGVPYDHLAERTSRVFQHLHVRLQLSLYEMNSAAETQSRLGGQTVVVVRHKDEIPETYVENRLLYPRVHSGSLALELHRLGLRQIDGQHGDDDDSDEEEVVDQGDDA